MIGATPSTFGYSIDMTTPSCLIEDDEAVAEAGALAAAISASDLDPRTVPHDELRAWLLRLADGEFDIPLPGNSVAESRRHWQRSASQLRIHLRVGMFMLNRDDLPPSKGFAAWS